MTSLTELKKRMAVIFTNIKVFEADETWRARIEADGNRPEDWLQYISHLKNESITKTATVFSAYYEAIEAIDVEKHMENINMVRLFLEYKTLKIKKCPEEAVSMLKFARSTFRNFVIVHVEGAEFELQQGEVRKAERIMEKAKLIKPQPYRLLLVAMRNLEEGRPQLLTSEQREECLSMKLLDKDTDSSGQDSSGEVQFGAIKPAQSRVCGEEKKDDMSGTLPLTVLLTQAAGYSKLQHYHSTPDCSKMGVHNSLYSNSKWKRSSASKKLSVPMRVKRTIEEDMSLDFKPFDTSIRANELETSSGEIADTANNPEDWLEYISHLNSDLPESVTKTATIFSAYCQAIKTIDVEKHMENINMVRLFLEYRTWKTKKCPEEAVSMLKFARSTFRNFVIVHVEGAEFELQQGEVRKAERIMEKAKHIKPRPYSLLLVALRNLEEGRLQLLTSEQREECLSIKLLDKAPSPDSSGRDSSGEVQFGAMKSYQSRICAEEKKDDMSGTVPLNLSLTQAAGYNKLQHYHSTPDCSKMGVHNSLYSNSKWKRSSASKKLSVPMRVKRTIEEDMSLDFKPFDTSIQANESSLKGSSTSSQDSSGEIRFNRQVKPSLGSAGYKNTVRTNREYLGKAQRVKVNVLPSANEENHSNNFYMSDREHDDTDVDSSGYLSIHHSDISMNMETNQPPDSQRLHPPVESQRLHPPVESQRLHPPVESQRLHPPVESQGLHPPVESQRLHPPVELQRLHLQVESQRLHPPVESQRLHPPVESSQRLVSLLSQPTVKDFPYSVSATKQAHQAVTVTKTKRKYLGKAQRVKVNVLPSANEENHSYNFYMSDREDDVDHPDVSVSMETNPPLESQRLFPPASERRVSPLDSVMETDDSVGHSKPSFTGGSTPMSQPTVKDFPQPVSATKQVQHAVTVTNVESKVSFPTVGSISAPSCTPTSLNMANMEIITVNGQHYMKLNILGTGGSAQVFHVLDSNKNSRAIKCVDLTNANDVMKEGYMNEIRLLQRLQYCDSVIKMYDFEYNQSNNKLYVVMECAETDLATFFKTKLKNKKSLDDKLIKFYWKEMLVAVEALHKEGIIHSDLKPANFILVTGNLKLIDFGIANAIQQDKTSVLLTMPKGTPNYISPETLLDSGVESNPKHKISTKSDIWSLGCILYNMVYGKTPFHDIRNCWSKLNAIKNPEHVIQLPPIQDENLLDVLQKCLNRDPKQRPSATQLLSHAYLAEDKTTRDGGQGTPVTSSDVKRLLLRFSESSPGSIQALTKDMLQKLNTGQKINLNKIQVKSKTDAS